MAEYPKERVDKSVVDANSVQVRRTVEGILEDVPSCGDAAVHEVSERFDKWSPKSFRLWQADIDAIMAKVPVDTLADIRFAQTQVQNFALHQRAALKDIEVETLPGVGLGHKNLPIDSVGCYVPGGW